MGKDIKIKETKTSKDGSYRYYTKRVWDISKPCVMFIHVNPSESETNDVNNLVCISKENGYGSFYLCNLFSYITNDTHELTTMDTGYSIGGYNDDWLLAIAGVVDKIVLTWGVNGKIKRQCDHVIKLLGNYKLYTMGQDNKGYPLSHQYNIGNKKFKILSQ